MTYSRHNSDAARLHSAARKTLAHYEAQRRAATTERRRFLIDQCLDECRARLRLAEKELEKEGSER